MLAVDLNGSTVTNINNPLSNVFEGSLYQFQYVYFEGIAYTNGTKTYTYTFGIAQTNITSARVISIRATLQRVVLLGLAMEQLTRRKMAPMDG